MDLGVFFQFYSSDSFNRIVLLFNSRICVYKRLVGIKYSWKLLASADVVSVCVCQFIRVCSVCVRMC